MFAEAPKGVKLPPMQEPTNKANIYNSLFKPISCASVAATGSITIIYGTLSTKPEIKTDTRIITKNPAILLSPMIPRKKSAKSSSKPVSEMVPMTMKIPIKNQG